VTDVVVALIGHRCVSPISATNAAA